MKDLHLSNPSLIVTKLIYPAPNSRIVHRPRLFEILRFGLNKKLTCLIAPAGFGKTTLLSEWISTLSDMKWPVSWISLDKGDNDASRFWEYFIAALEYAQPEIRDYLSGIVKKDYLNFDLSFITLLVNTINQMEHPFSLILDDYHVISNQTIHDNLAQLIQYMPANMHLVISSRKELPLPVVKLQAKNEVIELRSSDLKFTVAETNAFFTEVLGFTLPSHDINRLNFLSEGWITGLVLAAPALKRLKTQNEIDTFINNFSGDFQHVLTYLTNEVLENLSTRQNDFLLKTSILSELSPEICDAIPGISNSQSILNDLQRENLFLNPVNGADFTFRYHVLFQKMLRSKLKQKYSKEEIDHLHQAACDKYRELDDIPHAIPHALASGKEDLAIEIIEDYLTNPRYPPDHTSAVLDWFQQISQEALDRHPLTWIFWAVYSLIHGFFDQSEMCLKEIERLLHQNPDAYPDKRSVDQTIASIRAAIRCVIGRDVDSIAIAEQVLQTLDDTAYTPRVLLEYYIALAYQAFGDQTFELDDLIELNRAMYQRHESRNFLSYQALLAEIFVQRGQVYQAMAIYQESLEYIRLNDLENDLVNLVLEMGLSDIYREWNDLELAEQYSKKAKEQFLNYKIGEPCWLHSTRTLLLIAKNCISIKNYRDAKYYLDIAIRRAHLLSSIPSLMTSINEVQIHYWLITGELRKAASWARNKKILSPDKMKGDPLSDQLLIAQISLFENRPHETLDLLSELIPKLQTSNQRRRLIKAKIMQSIALCETGQTQKGIKLLVDILPVAEKENYIRLWLEMHPKIRELVVLAVKEYETNFRNDKDYSTVLEYGRRILSAFEQKYVPSAIKPGTSMVVDLTFEELTNREQEVLSLLASGMTTSRIAESLTISSSTAKTHVRNIYQKLGVNSRKHAVDRAKELQLIELI